MGHAQLTSAGLAISAVNNVIVLLISNSITIFRFPRRLVTVRSGVEAVEMSEADAVSIRSYHCLSHGISNKYTVTGLFRHSVRRIFEHGRRLVCGGGESVGRQDE
jgi:hypothetical protein